MARSFYSRPFLTFLQDSESHVLGELTASTSQDLALLQRGAWVEQIRILRDVIRQLGEGQILFEFTIPRLGKRIDNVLILPYAIILLEFKVGEKAFHRYQIDQVLDYALDLKYFHEGSRERLLAPVLVCTNAAAPAGQPVVVHDDQIMEPRLANSSTLLSVMREIEQWTVFVAAGGGQACNAVDWEASRYSPTPTIIEAAQALYANHDVREISRSDANAVNLSDTSDAIMGVIHESRANGCKSICFVTGVPGAGKTLAGLNIANQTHSFESEEHAVFLSGNGPLVQVLREALARDEVERSQGTVTKKVALQRTSAFIQNIHHFRDEGLQSERAPIERVVIFDEAQRAWTSAKTSAFMQEKKGIHDFGMSEPEFLIEVMNRHTGWAVIVCLVGGGQEIHTGEAGLPEWFRALRGRFSGWRVFVSDRLTDDEYLQGSEFAKLIEGLDLHRVSDLHLAVSARSFRSEQVAGFVKALLDARITDATRILETVLKTYPIMLTRDLDTAKEWVRSQARGNERTGLIASSGAHRLRPFGIWVSNEVDPPTWFLNTKQDVRSSTALEMTATEFDIQGLELDWTIVAWDADLRYVDETWAYHAFRGSEWQTVHAAERIRYLVNAYRVLLTRARQGMVVYVPYGNADDPTRLSSFYDGVFGYLHSVGLPVL